jgi:hypothetical protein
MERTGEVGFDYRVDLFEAGTVDALGQDLVRLIDVLSANPGARISEAAKACRRPTRS